MSRDLLTMLNSVLGRSGFLQRTSFAASSDPDAIQMVEYINRASQHMLNYAPWPKLRTTKQETLTTATTYALPSDFLCLVPESAWKTSNTQALVLPTSDRAWGYLQASSTTTGTTYHAKLIGGELVFDAVTSGDTIQYDYISNAPVQAADDSYKERFTADTDIFVLDEETLLLGTAAFWKAEKGIETAAADYAAFRRSLNNAVAKDVGARTIRNREPDFRSPLAADYSL